jgi:hypothetical protein
MYILENVFDAHLALIDFEIHLKSGLDPLQYLLKW